jgi:choice-of-anchor C domain-containing protein
VRSGVTSRRSNIAERGAVSRNRIPIMSLRSVVAALALTTAATAASASAQNLVANGSFETPAITGAYATYAAGNALTGWTIASGSVDLIRNYWNASSGLQSLDMNGSSTATLSQFLTTNVGSTYDLTFMIAGNPDGAWDKQLNVFWNGVQLGRGPVTFAQAGNNHASMGWTQISFAGLAATSTSTELRFEGLDSSGGNGAGPYMGAALDDVSVVTATPEPSTYLLMGTGMLALASVARRRRSA